MDRDDIGTAQPTIRIRLLGGFDIEVDGRAVPGSSWRLAKAAHIVKLLALAPGHRLHREQLMDILWPDKDPVAAANNLHQALHIARLALRQVDPGPPVLVLRDAAVWLSPPGGPWVDVAAFEDAAHHARIGQVSALEEARSLYRGELLPEDRYQDWAVVRREQLAQTYRRILSDLATTGEQDGDLEGALASLRELLDDEPTDEVTHRRIMQLEVRAGRPNVARHQYATLVEILKQELDAEPSAETHRLHRDLLAGRIDPVATRHVPTVPSARLTSFVGRQRELQDVRRLLGVGRLVTLTGTGGTGKTRLAIEAAHSARGDFPGGVELVELGGIAQPALVVRAVADALGVREPSGVRLLDLIAGEIGSARNLIVLDNCEHLLDACAALGSHLLAACPNLRILATSRQPLRIAGEVVLRVSSLAVPDLARASNEADLSQVDSVRLFLDRARAADPSFAVTQETALAIASLCLHLDGLPLAIELAAARAGSLPLPLMVERLDRRFELLVGGNRTSLTRQQTLRATLDWSYDLLTSSQQRVLRWLSVFAGGASVEAGEAVCAGGDVRPDDVLGILGDLVDRSMLNLDVSGPRPRYRLLETVREYAHERLIAAGEGGLAEAAHLAWMMAVTARVAAIDTRDDWVPILRDMAEDNDDLRGALDRAVRIAPDSALELAASAWPFWLWDGHLTEGRRWLTRVVDATSGSTDSRARALIGLCALLGRLGEPPEVAARAAEAVEIRRELGDAGGVCRALQYVGFARILADQFELAEDAFDESIAAAASVEFDLGRAAALNNLGVAQAHRGDARRAERAVAESLAILRDHRDGPDAREVTPILLDLAAEVILPRGSTGRLRLAFQETFATFRELRPTAAEAYVLGNRGMLRRAAGEPDAARRDVEDALALFRDTGDERGIAHAMALLGNIAAEVGELGEGRELLQASLGIRARLGDSRGVALARSDLGDLETAAGDFELAHGLLTSSVDDFRRRGDRWGLAGAVANLANLALARGDHPEARRCLEQGLIASRSTSRPTWIGWMLIGLAMVARLEGRIEESSRTAHEAMALLHAIGDARGEAEARALSRPG